MLSRVFHSVFLVLLTSSAWAGDLLRAEQLFRAGDPALAPLLQGLLRDQPDQLDLNLLQIRLDLAREQHEAALQRAERLVEIAPDSAQAHLRLADAYAARINHVGRWAQMRMAGRLRDALQRALELEPGLVEAHEGLLLYYLQAPWIAGGSLDKAGDTASRIAKLDPARGMAAEARLRAAREQPEAAGQRWAAACRIEGGRGPLCMEYGYWLQQQMHWDEAFALFRGWITASPEDTAAWYQLGRSSAMSGRETELGIDALHRYLTLPARFDLPAAEHAWFRLGQIHLAAGDREAARQAWKNALNLAPDHDAARSALAALDE